MNNHEYIRTGINVNYQWFYFAYLTAEYRLFPNPKKACIFQIFSYFFPIWEFIPKFKRHRLYPKVGNKMAMQVQ